MRLFLILLVTACGATPDPAPAPVPDVQAAPAAFAFDLPAGLPAPQVPEDNPMTTAKVALGHKLFMDKRLSGDGSRSCYSCHQNSLGNADGLALALGAGDKPLTRNTPTIWNVAYHRELYWDGRADSLEAQALGALKGGNMGVGADTLDAKAAEIGTLYKADFDAVFGASEAVTPMQVVQALSAYQRTLLCGDPASLDTQAQRGKELFQSKAGCAACHLGPAYSDGLYHDIGLGHDERGLPIAGADIGRGKIDPAMTGRFRTPTLRNVGATAPYFHDGRTATLEEAVAYMAGGGNLKAPNNDPILSDKGLSADELADLTAFLRSLGCGQLVEIGDQSVPGITE